MFKGLFVSDDDPLYEFETSHPPIVKGTLVTEPDMPELVDASAARAQRTSTAEDILWHKRLGHASDERVNTLRYPHQS
jgi:hypothetical protein